MTGDVDICNRALSEAQTQSAISSLSDDGSEAALCRMHYASTRDALQRAHLWSFTRRQSPGAVVAAASGTPENPSGTGATPEQRWTYAYAWPSDCLRFRGIYQRVAGGATPAYRLSTADDASGNPRRVVLTDQSQAQLIYSRRIVNPDLFDVDFTDALVFLLAARLAIPLSGDKTLAASLKSEAQAIILQARGIDDSEDGTPAEHVPDWIKVRGFDPSDTDLVNAVLSS